MEYFVKIYLLSKKIYMMKNHGDGCNHFNSFFNICDMQFTRRLLVPAPRQDSLKRRDTRALKGKKKQK